MKDGHETCVFNPGLKKELKVKQTVKKDYTEMTVCKCTMSGIHPARVFLMDRDGNRLLLGNITEGATWYLPEDVELGYKGGQWHFAADAYCEDVFSASYED